MNYTLHQLQVFIKVVDLKSVTKASEELFMSQPAVSIQLKNLQDQFDIPLTEVIGRKLHVTDFGKEIYQMAKRIIEEVEAINYKTMAYKGFLTGKLSFSIVSTGKYVMPYFITEFLNKNPGIDLVMDVTNKTKVLQSVISNEIDFALVSVVPNALSVYEEILLENNLFVVGRKSIMPNKKQFEKNDFKELPLVFREEGSATRYFMEQYLKTNRIQVPKKIELTSNEAVKQAIIAGLGYSIMPIIGLKNELKSKDLVIIPTKGFPVKSDWRIIWLKNKKLSPVASAYIDFLRSRKTSIRKSNFSWIENYK